MEAPGEAEPSGRSLREGLRQGVGLSRAALLGEPRRWGGCAEGTLGAWQSPSPDEGCGAPRSRAGRRGAEGGSRLPVPPAGLRGRLRPRSLPGASRSDAAGGSLPSKMADSLPEHDRILQEIESTDTACVGPTLR